MTSDMSMITKERLQEIREELGRIEGPVMPEQMPRVKVDLRGVVKYASEKGVEPADLSDEEKAMFVAPLDDIYFK